MLLDRLSRTHVRTDEEDALLVVLDQVIDDVIRPNAAVVDRNPEAIAVSMKALNDLGLNSVFIGEDMGPAELSYATYLECVRRIAGACASTAITWATNFHAVKPILDFGTPDQRQRLLPAVAAGGQASLCITEPHAGSDATQLRLSMTPKGDRVVLSGTKTFITNGDHASVYLVFGKWSGIADHRKALSTIVVEAGTPGLECIGKIDKMGHRGSATVILAFDECEVPLANVIGEPGDGLKVLLASLNKSRPSIGAHALGIAREAFETTVRYINEREVAGGRIIEHQGIQFELADLASELALTERWLWHVADLVDSGESNYGVEASILKVRATDLAMRMTIAAVQMHGGYGYTTDYPVERLMRDAKITQIWEGSNEIQRQFVGRSFLQRP